jgi:hypothetical protein
MNPDPTSLDRLHDVIAPPPVPWWPPAPGWVWVMGFFFVLALVLVLRLFLKWQHNRYRREALAEWKRQDVRLLDSSERASALTEMSVLLKRVAVTAFPRREVAPLHGSAWLAFLNRTTGTMAYSNSDGAALESAAYNPRSAAEIGDVRAQKISELVLHWITRHRLDFQPRSRSRPSSSNTAEDIRGRRRERGTRTKDDTPC